MVKLAMTMSSMLRVVPVLSDNLAYLVYSLKNLRGFIVDPVEPQKLLHEAERHSVQLVACMFYVQSSPFVDRRSVGQR
jgi:hypothetical protein